LEILKSVAGSQLDERIVEIFTEIVNNDEDGFREEEGTGEGRQ
jgi:HD-GYP domain-containing protein (c-di-GMP phosphodiesterase class II)